MHHPTTGPHINFDRSSCTVLLVSVRPLLFSRLVLRISFSTTPLIVCLSGVYFFSLLIAHFSSFSIVFLSKSASNMFNRTAEYITHGARSIGPLAKLQPEQRRRVEKSSEKIGRVLGEMPIIDIIPLSPRAVDGIASGVGELKQGKKGGKWKKKAFSPPVLRLKLTPLRRKSTWLGPRTPRTPRTPRADARPSRRSVKPVPDFDLAEPMSYVDLIPRPAVRMSQARYVANIFAVTGWVGERAMCCSAQQDVLFLSPLPPVSPFSPIETAVALEQQYQTLRHLACGLPDTAAEKLPSVSEAIEPAKNVSSYLDLYRVANQSVREIDAASTVTDLATAYTAYTDATNPDDAYTAFIACTPVSARHHRRRSSSFSCAPRRPSALSNGTASPVPRSSFVVPHSASVYSFKDQPGRYTLVIKVPSPLTPSTLVPFPTNTANSSFTSRVCTFVLDTPRARRDTLETPGDDSCPLQKQQREARVRAVLEAMDKSVGPASTPSVPQTPARTPRGPYWVRQSYRISGQGSVRRRKSSARVPPTPRTVRRERRQGWGGEWRAGKMGAAVDGLREIKTPAPPVPPKEEEDAKVPPVPTKDFIIVQ